MDEELIKKAFVEGFRQELEKIALGWLGTLGLHVGLPLALSFMGGAKKPATTGAGRKMQIAPR